MNIKMPFFAILILIVLSALQLKAQNHPDIGSPWLERDAEVVFNKGNVIKPGNEWSMESSAEAYIYASNNNLKDKRSKLKIRYSKESPVAYHYDFIQLFGGTEIYGTNLKINIGKKDGNKILSVFDKTIATISWDPPQSIPAIDEEKLKSLLAKDALTQVTPVYFLKGKTNFTPSPAYKVDYSFENGLKHEELIVSTDYKIIFRRNLILNLHKKDTTAVGYVFLPDPLTTANVKYGPPYIDNNDGPVPELDNERKLAQFPVTIEGDSMYLSSKYVRIAELGAPVTPPTYSKNGVFLFSRSEPGFEDVNAVYHINAFQEYIQRLGFTNLATYQIPVDAHGLLSDNSQFDGTNNGEGTLRFGIGGVDDAEDADVIVHEYCHAISHSASNSAFGFERNILEEAICDYFACSYSKELEHYGWDRLFNWDGHNPFYEGRHCVTTKKYPESITNGGNRIHDLADLWTGAMMDINDAIGREKADRLMLLALYSFSRQMKHTDAAALVLQADSLLFDGEDILVIANKFLKYGMLPAEYYKTNIEETPTTAKVEILSNYFSSDNLLYIKFSLPQTGRLVLYDLQGKQLYSNNITKSADLNIYLPEFAKGLYVLNISTDGIQKSIKLLKK